jgi:hypothetical protein
MILTLQGRIQLWDVGVSLSDETIFINRGPTSLLVWDVKEPSLTKAVSARHRSRFKAMSLVLVTTTSRHAYDAILGDDELLFYVPLKNISLIWRRHHCR